MKRILYFGDSIVAGNMLPATEKALVWPLQVETLSRGELHCLNAGKGGRPTDSFGEFVPELARSLPVDLLVLALGANDSRDLKPDCADRAAANIERMIAQARSRGVENILIVAPCNINLDALGPTKPIGPQRDAQLKRIGEAYRKLRERLKVAFADTYGVVSPANLTRDGVHPNAAGNHEIAEYMLPILQRLCIPH